MSNVLEATKQQQILALGQLGWPVSRIGTAVGVDRATVTRYLRAARLPVRGRGRPSEGVAKPAISPEVSTDPLANPAISSGEVSTDSAPSCAPQASACEPYRDRIEAALTLGRNAMAIWQDLVDEVGFTARYASVRRFVRQLRGATPPEARVVIDDGRRRRPSGLRRGADGPPPADRQVSPDAPVYPDAGARAKRCGSCCGTRARRSGRSSTSARFDGWAGRPASIVLDNLKEGVLMPDIYEPALNPLYREVLAHYGVVGLPCRVGDPDRKGKVESGDRPHAEDAAPRPPLRDDRAGPDLSRSLGGALGRYADPRHDEAASGGDVCRGAARAAAAPARALSLLPLRRAARCTSMAASKSRPRTTRRHPAGSGSASRSSGRTCTSASSHPKTGQLLREHRPRATRASSDRRRRPAGAHAGVDRRPPGARAPRRPAHPHGVHVHSRPRGRRGRPPHPRRARARQTAWRRPSPTTRPRPPLEIGVPTYRFVRTLSRTPAARAAHAAASRSAHPPAHALSRSH